MAKITKPDANPIVSALLTWFVFGIGHLVINGQQKKWLMILVCTLIGSICICPGIVIAILSTVDAYKTAEKLKAGKEIDENEYSNALLFKICKLLHKEAILVE